MKSYQLYCLDAAGHISLAEWIEAQTDAEAVQQAAWMKQGSIKCEVWEHRRLVATIDGQTINTVYGAHEEGGPQLTEGRPQVHRPQLGGLTVRCAAKTSKVERSSRS